MAALGATAVSRCTPSNPSFNLPQAIGEAREGGLHVPGHQAFQSWKKRTSLARSAGKEHLGLEFGWKPLVSELRTFAKAVNNSHEIWQNYRKGSDQKTRAGYHYPTERDSRSYSGYFVPLPSEFGSPFGFLEGSLFSYRERKTWFKGAFRYHIPEPVDFHSKMQYWHSQAGKILGVRLTPDTVWNLNPWTWAADWFANTGDLMTNVSNLGTDGLVLQYGYVMDEESIRTDSVGRIPWMGVATSRKQLFKRCKRVGANPYGFYATLATLTERQLAIIAALGLSHGGR